MSESSQSVCRPASVRQLRQPQRRRAAAEMRGVSSRLAFSRFSFASDKRERRRVDSIPIPVAPTASEDSRVDGQRKVGPADGLPPSYPVDVRNATDAKPAALRPQVILLSFASLLNDVSSEMIFPLLPVFLTVTLGATPVIVGLIEGSADA